MKSYLLGLILACCALSVSAMPINFAFDGGSASATGAVGIGSYTGYSGSASLDDGESANFTFGNAAFVGYGDGELSIGVNFISPIFGEESVTGAYEIWSLGFIAGGKFAGGSTIFDYIAGDYVGSAELTLDPFDVKMQCGACFNFDGKITNLGSVNTQEVPEPLSAAFLGLGLLAFGLTRRQRR